MLNLTPSQEDYLESIYLLSQKNNSEGARIKELVDIFKVKAPSVVEVISVLKRKKLVTQLPYRPIVLTEKGYRYAEDVYIRHNKIKDFLQKVLFVDEQLAEENACKMEHSLDNSVISRMVKFMEIYVENVPESIKKKICEDD